MTRKRMIKDLKKVLHANQKYDHNLVDVKISKEMIPLLENVIKDLEKSWWKIWK